MSFDPALVAAELAEAEQTATPIPLLSSRFADLTWSDSRAVARCRDLLRSEAGDRMIGYKLGWTSAVMRSSLGIEHPNWGTLWQSQLVGATPDLDTLIHPKVEPELVYRCEVDLAGDAEAHTIANRPGTWALGLEVVDPRWPSYDFDLLDNTADNSSCARIVVGEFSPLADPSRTRIELDNGTTTLEGVGSNAMGDPCEAVAWLARSLADEGRSLRAGEIVFTGGLTVPLDLESGRTYSVRSASMSRVELVSSRPGGDFPVRTTR